MIDVAVETIVSRRDWGVIFSATVLTKGHADHGRRIRVRASISAMSDAPEVGETWAIDGEVLDTAYGRQVDAEAARRVMPDGALVRGYLAFNVPGIGRDRASRLWDAFGDTLGTVLSDERNIPRIAEVIAPDRPLLALRIAAATVAAWRAAASEAAAMAWMDGHGVSNLAVARRVVRILGDEAVGILADNPYILVPLLPWKNVDALGRRLLPTIGATGWDVRRFDEVVDHLANKGEAFADFHGTEAVGPPTHLPGEVEELATAAAALENGSGLEFFSLPAWEAASDDLRSLCLTDVGARKGEPRLRLVEEVRSGLPTFVEEKLLHGDAPPISVVSR